MSNPSKTKTITGICVSTLIAIAISYYIYISYILKTATLQANIIYAAHGYALIPSSFARTYFLHSKKINREISNTIFPVIPYTIAGIFSPKSSDQHVATFALVNHELSLGADINARFHGFTALYSAVLLNDPVTVKYLLKHGANPNVKAKPRNNDTKIKSMTPLQLALNLQNKYPNKNYSEIIELLQEATPSE